MPAGAGRDGWPTVGKASRLTSWSADARRSKPGRLAHGKAFRLTSWSGGCPPERAGTAGLQGGISRTTTIRERTTGIDINPVIILSESSYDGLGEKFRKAISRGLNRI
ncbi:MAG: hypothetical protein QOI53_3286 [Verrucomicrobiota bacterium]|nr:hypothetical protein [Verrucomicrobiota bacterium]